MHLLHSDCESLAAGQLGISDGTSECESIHTQTFNVSDLGSGMDCPKTSFQHRHFQVSGADLNPSSSSSHILILSSNCTFDTIVVLVVMFII